jgi:hypothetical protein
MRAEVIDYLGLSGSIAKVPPPPLRKQATELNERLLENLLSYLGIR